ncbi:MAG: hypothetical protein ACKO7B_21615, partial [Flavobacteriales bacterium]
VDAICNTLNPVNSGSNLVVLLLAHIEDHVGGLAPLALYHVPYLLNRIQSAALWWEELRREIIVEVGQQELGVVHLQVVHDYDRLALLALLLQCNEEGEERVDGVATNEA